MNITDVKGVSAEKAEQLKEMNINLMEDLACANVSLLDQADGLSPQLVVNAQMELNLTETLIKEEQMSYHCGECGQYFNKNMRLNAKVHQRDCNGELAENADTTEAFVL